MAEFLFYAIPIFIAFIIGVLITRWIFRIDKIVAAQQEQTELLRAIAVKLGANIDSDELEETQSKPLIKLKEGSNYFSDDDLEREALSHPKE